MGELQQAPQGPTLASLASDHARPADRSGGGEAGLFLPDLGLGNAALQRLLPSTGIQAKLDVSSPGDPYEREADRVADQVMRMPDPAPAPAAHRPVILDDAKDDEKKKVDRMPEPIAISRLPGGYVNRAEAPKKPDDDQKTKAVQRAAAEPKKDDDQKTKAVQRAAEPKKDDDQKTKAVQRAAAEPKKDDDQKARPVQREAAEPLRDDDELGIQRKADAAPQATPAVESMITASRGQGQPLPGDTQSYFESRFGRDLGDVRIHADGQSDDAARALSAQAFTHGNDIHFAAGKYQPHTEDGRRLLAHELTHTVQQTGTIARTPAPRTGGSGAAPSRPAGSLAPDELEAARNQGEDKGKLTESTITFSTPLRIPQFKLSRHGARYAAPLVRPAAYNRAEVEGQGQAAGQGASGTSAGQQLWSSTHAAGVLGHLPNEPQLLYKGPRQTEYYFGTRQELASRLTIPTWDRRGRPAQFHVDHIKELQLGGGHTDTNLELVDASLNTSSGSVINNSVIDRVEGFLAGLGRTRRAPGQANPLRTHVLSTYHLRFTAQPAGHGGAQGDEKFWRGQEEIQAGTHLSLSSAPLRRVDSIGGDERHILVFPSASGGIAKSFTREGNTWRFLDPASSPYLKPFRLHSATFTPPASIATAPGAAAGAASAALGSLRVNLRSRFLSENAAEVQARKRSGGRTVDRQYAQRLSEGDVRASYQEIPVLRHPTHPYAGIIDKAAVRRLLGRLSAPLCVLQPGAVDLDAEGRVTGQGGLSSELPILARAGINFELREGELVVSKRFAFGELQVPRPLRVTGGGLELALGSESGVSVSGGVQFEIDRVGRGEIVASWADSLQMEGRFAIDTRIFRRSEVAVRYRGGAWSGGATLEVDRGVVPGVQSGTVQVNYEEGRLSASGDIALSIPGTDNASIAVSYSEQEGLALRGQVALSRSIPRLRSGTVDVEIRKRPNAEGVDVSANGTALLDIPGVDTTIRASYLNGAFLIEGSAAYRRGMLSGTLRAGVTNQPLGPDGNPVPGGAPERTLRIFGGGSLTLRLTPWLEGTAGVRILQNGELEVQGSIGLPSAIDLLPARTFRKNLFRVGIDIPIVGVSFAGSRIGIFANISGGLDADAAIGPVQLRNLRLGVTYNPSHEEQTRITGDAELYIPAHAGLRLSVRGGIGAGLLIVSATGFLEVGATLGIEGFARAAVHVDWSPSTGLAIDAVGELAARPSFTFDLSAGVVVEASLLFTSITLYERRWTLASFTYGSDLEFGVRFPVRYREGTPFDISLDDLEFRAPRIDTRELLSGLVRRFA